MKKFTAEYFEKKYRILFNKLLIKKGFLEAVKETRTKLGLPKDGFKNETELAYYFLNKLGKKEKELLTFFVFINDYAYKNKLNPDNTEDRAKIVEAYVKSQMKKQDKNAENIQIIPYLIKNITDHSEMITKHFIFEKNKVFSKLFPETHKLIGKFWSLDLLDEHIMGHFVEKYLFLGNYGVNQYIKNRLACSNCRYIGVNHFSPERHNMKSNEAFGKNYIFNEATVRHLSIYFNCVFLIIEPYATKEEVLQYVEDNWSDLKEHIIEKNSFYKQYDVHPSKIKESNFERNQLIYELYKQSKKELLKIYQGEEDLSLPNIYKEMIISAILKNQYNIDVSADAVKKSATRFAKNTNPEKKMKDIRDI